MSSIAAGTQQENIQRRRRYCVQDVVDFYKAQTPNRLPKDKEGESKFYRFIYKQISTNGNQLADLIATFKKLGVNILSHIHTKKGKVKQTEQLEWLRCIVTSPEKIVDEAVIAQMKEFEEEEEVEEVELPTIDFESAKSPVYISEEDLAKVRRRNC